MVSICNQGSARPDAWTRRCLSDRMLTARGQIGFESCAGHQLHGENRSSKVSLEECFSASSDTPGDVLQLS